MRYWPLDLQRKRFIRRAGYVYSSVRSSCALSPLTKAAAWSCTISCAASCCDQQEEVDKVSSLLSWSHKSELSEIWAVPTHWLSSTVQWRGRNEHFSGFIIIRELYFLPQKHALSNSLLFNYYNSLLQQLLQTRVRTNLETPGLPNQTLAHE